MNSLFAATQLNNNPTDSRRARSLLLASIICSRLDHWSARSWPTPDMPAIAVYQEQQLASKEYEQSQELYNLHQKRLHILQRQAAQAGINADPALLIEINDIQVKLADLHKQMESKRC